MLKKAISLILSISLILTQPVFAQGVAELNIGKYLNQMPVLNTDSFRPPHLRYISYDLKSNDFKLLLDQGDFEKSPGQQVTRSPEKSENAFKIESKNLFNYFLIGLSLPNDKFWVNLRPDAPEQIIDPLLEKTDMGKIMLEADLQLKKDTAGLTSPQNPEGKEYWDKLYKKAGELFGTENITIPTITRPWIVPGEVIIRESEDSAYIYKANLKVMLEEDYLKGNGSGGTGNGSEGGYEFKDPRMKELNKYSTQLIKELILPRLTQEVNTSKKYAQLRQVFFSLILSRWFKDKYKGKLGQYSGLIDSRNLDNLTSKDSWSKDYYFSEYKNSFQQGEYSLKEQITTPTGQVIRSYVSGGADWTNIASSSIMSNDYKFWRVAAISGLILLSAWGLNYSSIQIKKETQKNYLALEINVDSWTKLHEYLPNYDSIKYYYDKYKDSIPGSDVSWLTPTDNDVVPWLTKIIMEEGNIFTIQFYKKPSIVDTLGLDSEVFFIKYRPSKVPLIEITGSFPDSIGSFPGNIGQGKYIKYLKGGIDNLRRVLGSPTDTSSPLAPQEGASSAITADKEKVSNILINLSNLLPEEVRLKDKGSIYAIPKNIEDGHTLIRWAEKTIDSLYEAWVENEYNKLSLFGKFIVFWKMDPLRRILPEDVLKPELERKYPVIKKGFDAARSELNKISEAGTEFIYRFSVLPVRESPAKAEDAKLLTDSKLSIMQIINDYEETLFYRDAGLRIEILKELEEIVSRPQLEEFLKEEKGRLLDIFSAETQEDYLIIEGMYNVILSRITHEEAVSSQLKGSSPLAPEEGASSAVADIRDEVKNILTDLKNSLPDEVGLGFERNIEDIPNDLKDAYGLLGWAKSVKNLLYEKWYKVAYAKQSWWERFMERFWDDEDFHSVLRIKYPEIDGTFGVARDKLNNIEEDIRKREKARILMERKKKVEDFISVAGNKEKIMAVSRFREDFMRRTEARNNRSVPKKDEDIPYLCYMIYAVVLLDGDRHGADEWWQAYQSEMRHPYITHPYGHFDNTSNDSDISQGANDEIGHSHSSDYHGVDRHDIGIDHLGDLGSSPLVSQEGASSVIEVVELAKDIQEILDQLYKDIWIDLGDYHRLWWARKVDNFIDDNRGAALDNLFEITENIIDNWYSSKDLNSNKKTIRTAFDNARQKLSDLRRQKNQTGENASSLELETGGIDFTRINYLTQPMGSFQGLDLRLPLLSKAELAGIDINKELASVEQMVNARIDVSTDRLKRLLVAMSQKDAFTSQREIQLLPLLLRLCWLKEEKGTETTPDFRAVLLIADTGLFVEQGNTRYLLN